MNDFYMSKRWKQTRAAILRRDGYRDMVAARYTPFPPEATLVHHILPREDWPEYSFARWNLISVSMATHNRLHNPDGSLSEEGRKLMERTARKNGIRLDRGPEEGKRV